MAENEYSVAPGFRLYLHHAALAEPAHNGKNIVVVTPTASGNEIGSPNLPASLRVQCGVTLCLAQRDV